MPKFFIPKKIITLAIQNQNIKLKFPDFFYRWSGNTGVWIGTIKPTPISTSYNVKIIYKFTDIPKVEVIEPDLKIREGEIKIPHTYSGKRPCIYYPKTDWDKSKLIATTVIPWFALWLYYYEIWFATGEWLGGGRHPEIK